MTLGNYAVEASLSLLDGNFVNDTLNNTPAGVTGLFLGAVTRPGGVGRITTTATTSRQIQFGLKLVF